MTIYHYIVKMETFEKKGTTELFGEKKEIPDGLWIKCDACGEIIYRKELERHLWVCPKCDHHMKIPPEKYIEILIDNGEFQEFDANICSADPISFVDSKPYPKRISEAIKLTGHKEAIIAGLGCIGGILVSFGVMDFRFIGGSMGSVVGEKVSRILERSIEKRIPAVIVCASGGARMQESILSLMQMAKTSAVVARLHRAGLPYINILTNPTTAGVMASYASLADVTIAEPKALLGFAGPRVIKETIRSDLPPGFQSSEFFLEHGFVDIVCHRLRLRETVAKLLFYMI